MAADHDSVALGPQTINAGQVLWRRNRRAVMICRIGLAVSRNSGVQSDKWAVKGHFRVYLLSFV
jgi:hypothetical protein